MENVKLVIVIRGGNLEAVYANRDIQYVLVDHDNLDIEIAGFEGDFDLSKQEPDLIAEEKTGGLAQLFRNASEKGSTRMISRNKRIAEELEKLNF